MSKRDGEALVQRSQGRPRPVVPRTRSLPDGVPAPSGGDLAGEPGGDTSIRRNAAGHPVNHEEASKLGRRGGLKAAERRRREADIPALVRKLGLRDVSAPDFLPYLPDAEELAEHECARLARFVGGGHCGTAPSVLVQTAALQVAGSRFAFARGDLSTGSRLGDAARANLLSAHDLCAREAEARRKANPEDAHAAVFAAFGRKDPSP